MSLRTTLTAACLAGAMALTGAAPAAAAPDAEDILKTLAALAALGIIIDKTQDNDRPRQPVYQPRPQPHPGYGHGPRPGHGNPRYDVLPANCAIDIRGRNGWDRVYTSWCLDRNGFGRSLPQRCEREVRTDQGWRVVYGEQCLRQAGYRVEARRY